MAQINNDQQVYALLGRLFESVVADDEIGPRLGRIDAVVQQQFRRPDATVTIKLVAGEDRAVITGLTDLRPDIVLVMDAATGHRVWIGELSVMTALSKGQIRARGPVAKILQLIDLIALVAPRYRAQLEGVTAVGAPAEGVPVAEESPAEEAPADEASAEEVPVAEETPAEETPAEETPAEETPAEPKRPRTKRRPKRSRSSRRRPPRKRPRTARPRTRSPSVVSAARVRPSRSCGTAASSSR